MFLFFCVGQCAYLFAYWNYLENRKAIHKDSAILLDFLPVFREAISWQTTAQFSDSAANLKEM